MQSKLLTCLFWISIILTSCIGTQDKDEEYYNPEIITEDPALVCKPVMNTSEEVVKTNYVILTRKIFAQTLHNFAEEKASNFNMNMLLVEDLVNNKSNMDIPEQIRTELLGKYDPATENYLLIVGSPDPDKRNQTNLSLNHDWEVPIRYVPFMGEDLQPILDQEFIPTDQYYSSVQQDWNIGSYAWLKRFEFHADYLVGRVPIKTVAELQIWLAKNKVYKVPTAPKHSQFTNDACTQPNARFSHDFIDNFLATYTHDYVFHKCQSDDGGEVSWFANQEKADFVSLYGHGNSQAFVAGKKGYTLIAETANFDKPPIIYAHSCETASPDSVKMSLGVSLIANPSGAVAYVGYTRSNTSLIHPFWEYAFLGGELTLGRALCKSKQKLYKHRLPTPDLINDWMAMTLFGDPSLKIAKINHSIDLNTESISGGEPISVCAYVDSNGNSDEIFQTIFSEPIKVDLTAGKVAAGLELYPISDAHQLPKFNYLALSECDVASASCAGTSIRLTAVLDYTCNWFIRNSDGSKSFQVKANNAIKEPVTFVLKAAKGTFYPNGCKETTCGWDYRVLKEWTSEAVKQGWFDVGFSDSLINDPLPTDDQISENSIYLSGSLLLEAYTENQQLVGACYLNQTEYAPAFD